MSATAPGLTRPLSASPLNGQAAELWDDDKKEFQRQVLLRHRDIDDEEATSI